MCSSLNPCSSPSFTNVTFSLFVCTLVGERPEETQLSSSHHGGAQDPGKERAVGGDGGEGG